MFGADAGGAQTFANANITKLDGGAGNDTLKFDESANTSGSLSLTTANATNFENLRGTSGAETITGDANANSLEGNSGADTLNGAAGDDILLAYKDNNTPSFSDTSTDGGSLYTNYDYWSTRIKKNGILFLYLPDYSQEYWRPWNNRRHKHCLKPEFIHDYMVDKGYKNVFVSGVDLNNAFMVMGEK